MTPPRTRIIAEVGLAHDGSYQLACDYIAACVKARVDCVKFQWHLPEESTSAEPFRTRTVADFTRREYWRRTAFSSEQWRALRIACAMDGMGFMTSTFCPEAVAVAKDADQCLWKVPSGQVNNTFLLQAIAKAAGTTQAVYLSTGLATADEIEAALAILGDAQVTLMHCVSVYPTPPAQWRHGQIERLAKRYLRPVGLSDHSGTIAAPLAAVARGQCAAIEVHVTLSKDIHTPDAPVSLVMDDVRRLVDGIRQIEASRYPAAPDLAALDSARRMYMPSLVAKVDIPKGTTIQLTHLAFRKAGVGPGIEWQEVVGRVAARDIPPNAVFTYADIEVPCVQSAS